MRKPFIAGNWKMYKLTKEAIQLVNGIKSGISDVNGVDVAVCPPYTSLSVISEAIKSSKIMLGAQNVHWETKGAFTGEVSPQMLLDIGCTLVIIGHSERRTYFGETDETINKKIKSVLLVGLNPIFCVGETLSEREKGITEEIIKRQITEGLKDIKLESMSKITIAYEPVWAIGTGKTATPKQANDVHIFIRGIIKQLYGNEIAQNVRIQYGGSVKSENIAELMKESDIDGALVGGASLEADTFIKLIKNSVTHGV
ncbi:MAG: triose-phosphate isomerase [Candidatus Firestonebacteria bacterium]